MKTKNMTNEEIETDFERIAEIMAQQGDTDVLCELIPFEKKRDFVNSWYEE